MTEELETLWALRGLDDQLATLTAALSRYPAQRKSLEEHVSVEKRHLEDHRRATGDLQIKRRSLEKDIESLSAEERKFQNQLPMVKKNEEYQALLHEIAGAKTKRSDRETELLLLMDEEEKLGAGKSAIERALAAAEAETRDRLGRIAAEEGGERARVEALEAERAGLMGRLPPSTRSRYERIRASKDGRAVVAIVKGACGGCFRGQPPQVVQDARRGDRLLTCDGCGRLLIWPPEGAAV